MKRKSFKTINNSSLVLLLLFNFVTSGLLLSASAGTKTRDPLRMAPPSECIYTYYHYDGQGTLRATTDENGNVTERHEVKPFGEKTDQSLAEDKHLFTGKKRDAETGLDYFHARYYSNLIGRFLEIDPKSLKTKSIKNPQGWNLYSYCLNNPVKFIDPDGKSEIVPEIFQNLMLDYHRRMSELMSLTDPAKYKPMEINTDNETIGTLFLEEVWNAWFADPPKTIEFNGEVYEVRYCVFPEIGKGGSGSLRSLKSLRFKELKSLMGMWGKGTYRSVAESIRDHAFRKGFGKDVLKYMRKAKNFNYKGATKKVLSDGAVRWTRKSGEYIIKRDGKIVSYGFN